MKMKKILLTFFCCFLSLTFFAQTESSWSSMETEGEVLERHENAMARVGNKIILIGGRGQKPVNILDLESGEWSEGAQPPMEIHHMQAVSLDGLVYILGGFTGGWPHETPLTHVLVYDVREDVWAIGHKIPGNRRRGAAGVAVYNNRIYMINGIIDGHTSGWVNWMDQYDPYTGEWRALPDSPEARDHFHAAVIDSKLYVAGGRRSGSAESGFAGTVTSTNVYDFETGQWEMLPDIPTPRAGSTAAVLDGNLVILGGESDTQEAAHSEVEMLNINSNTWETLPELQEGRHGTQAIAINNRILIGAGSANRGGGPELSTFEIYSPEGSAGFETDNLERGEIMTSSRELTFSPENRALSFNLTNTGDTAILLSYLQTGTPDLFEILFFSNPPFILAPGAQDTFVVRAREELPANFEGTLLVKPLGEQAPLKIQLIAN